MRITEQRLRQIIKEEIRLITRKNINEMYHDYDEDDLNSDRQGVPDEAMVADDIIKELGREGAISFYHSCMSGSDPSADVELESYIESYSDGILDGSNERTQLKILDALKYSLGIRH